MSAADQAHRHHPAEVAADVAEVASGGLRAAEIAAAMFIGLLVLPPLLTLVVAVAVPMIAIAAVVGIVASVFVAPILLVRHVRAHHRTRGSTMFLHRLRRQ
jgi:Flp pilus assembly protein TadB